MAKNLAAIEMMQKLLNSGDGTQSKEEGAIKVCNSEIVLIRKGKQHIGTEANTGFRRKDTMFNGILD